jgi:probable HAF family extracellular repeat protein
MKLKNWTTIALATLAVTLPMSAQDNPQHKPKHRQYKLYDVGTLGGPSSYGSSDAIGITPAGAIGTADTPVPDPFSPNCLNGDCFVKHAIVWRNGVLTDLGAIPGNNGGNSSYAFAINNAGLIAGISETGGIDPGTGYPNIDPVIWQNGTLIDLGNFGGTQGNAFMVNNRGQVVGNALNTITDPYSFGGQFPGATQSRAFLWEKGVMTDLGTLGGPDATAPFISQSGLVAGWSYTSYTPNPDTGIPTIDPFLWRNGQMIDLGTLGGTIGYAFWVNNKGQVVGQSNVAGNQSYHGFLWDHGVLTDLGTLGGTYSDALWINEGGVVAGVAGLPGDTAFPAALWIHGQIINLGTLPGDNLANATSVNSAQQVVGLSCPLPCSDFSLYRAFLWENGGPIVDLNALVQPPSNLVVARPPYIDERGVVVAAATLPNGDEHLVVLMPDGDCEDACEQRIAEGQNTPAMRPAPTGATLPAYGKPSEWLRNALGKRFPMPGEPAAPSN